MIVYDYPIVKKMCCDAKIGVSMKTYQELSKEELLVLKAQLEAAYEDVKGKGLKLDMSRGKPGFPSWLFPCLCWM